MFSTHRKEITIIISIALAMINLLGLLTLVGTNPRDTLAIVFVIGVGMFWTQVQLLGFYAALLPCSMYVRLGLSLFLWFIFTLELVACDSSAFVFWKEVFIISATGFMTSLCIGLACRAFLRLRLEDAETIPGQENREAIEGRVGISDLLTITTLIAVLLAFYSRWISELNPRGLPIACGSYCLMALVFLPLNVLLFKEGRLRWVYLWLIVGCIVGLPTVVYFVGSRGLFGAVRTDHWPFMFCLTAGAEMAWLVAFGINRLLGFRFALGVPKRT